MSAAAPQHHCDEIFRVSFPTHSRLMKLVDLVLTLTSDLLSRSIDSVIWCCFLLSLDALKLSKKAESHGAFGQAVYHVGAAGSGSELHNVVHNVVCVV